jgi:hypothetical protein
VRARRLDLGEVEVRDGGRKLRGDDETPDHV